jgi:hypothetical protein
MRKCAGGARVYVCTRHPCSSTNTISVWNNGDGVPVAVHKVENVYVPEMIFGTLHTSSNFDDSQSRVTGTYPYVLHVSLCAAGGQFYPFHMYRRPKW